MFIEALIKLKDGSEKTIKAISDNAGIALMRFMWKIKFYAKKENKLIHVKTDSLTISAYLSKHLPNATCLYEPETEKGENL